MILESLICHSTTLWRMCEKVAVNRHDNEHLEGLLIQCSARLQASDT